MKTENPPKREGRVRLSLDVPQSVKDRLDEIKACEARSYTEIIRRALEAYGK